MLASVRSATLLGVEGRPITVEVHVASGLPAFQVVGLPDEACGLLGGPAVGPMEEPTGTITAVFPTRNADASSRTYTVDGRDLLGVLSRRTDAHRVTALLIEHDAGLAARAREAADTLRLQKRYPCCRTPRSQPSSPLRAGKSR